MGHSRVRDDGEIGVGDDTPAVASPPILVPALNRFVPWSAARVD